jgi:hypothetical protein
VVPAGREGGLDAVAEGRDGTPAVRLVADDDDNGALPVRGRDVADVVGRRPRRQPGVDRRLAEPERSRRLACTQQRAAHDGVRYEAVRTQPVAEVARLRAPVCGQRAQLVGVAGRRLGVSNDDEAHRGQDNLAPVDGPWERYLVLGLRLGRHIDGLVDAYFGPPELAARVDAEEPTAPEQLAAEARVLHEAADTDWLRAQLLGCETTARRLAGEPIGWVTEVERCYGLPPLHTAEARFEAAHTQLDEALPGGGALQERYQRWLDAQALPAERLLEASTRFADLLQRRTHSLFGLPDDEAATIETVANEPWSAFNYYLGGRRSRVVVNTDLPVYSFRLPELVAHEIYPGHHTEHAWKEALLVDGEHNLGEAIFLVGTPQSTISEGIASYGPELVAAHDLAEQVYDELGIEYDVATTRTVQAVRDELDGVGVNAALKLHVDGAPEGEVVEYIAHWALVPTDHAVKRLAFITHPTWRAYVSCYSSGYELCKTWVGGDLQRFRRLLTEQLTTSDLAA